MPKSKAYTCRMADNRSSLIEEAARTTEYNRAEILRRAFRHYVSVNPDEIVAFSSDESRITRKEDTSEKGSTRSSTSERNRTNVNGSPSDKEIDRGVEEVSRMVGIYDPIRELQQ